MKPFDHLSEYLGAIERRLRLLAWTRGAAVTAAAALTLTVLAVVMANQFSFSNPSVIGARVFLFLGLAFALAVALIVPVIRLNRRHAARKAEATYPQFEERLLTFTEKVEQSPNDPFLHLLAADALQVAKQAEAKEVAKTSVIFSFSSAAAVALLVLIWLGVSGPGFLGYGTSLLWGGLPKGEMKPFYAIKVEPGNKTVRKRADLLVSATLMGFQAPKVRFFAKYGSASQWEEAEMRSGAGGAAYQFLIAGVPETLDYYVEAGGVRSETYKVKVIDLPSVKKIRVTYHFPGWSGMPDSVEDPGGDLRAVEGTVAEVAVQTDRPLANGVLVMDDGTQLPLKSGADGMVVANVTIQRDGQYHIAAIESGEDVRLGNDYFIEAMKDQAPELRITRPGRDFRATPIEEVTVAVDAKDDFGLKEVSLHYSVNGGAEKAVPMLATKGAKNGSGTTVISLEDFKLVPGDVVSLYATAKDARKTVSTDMFFIEAQPFERNYTQSQQGGGGGGGGGDEDQDQNQISQRQKEIITATWNQIKGNGAKGTDAENAAFLASVQSKLRDQAKSLADRMKARQLEGAGESFKTFVEDMEKAVEAMGPASEKLKIAKWQDAMPSEQKALQHLMRAEATFRDIQVAFGQQRGGGGGGGGGGATRDLQGLFDLELDTEKNQYEGARQAGGQQGGDQQKAVDEALQKLKELAKRQQELAEQQRRNPQQDVSRTRVEQEQLRREAEKLQQQLQNMQQNQQLSRNGQGQQQQSQQGGQQGQQGQQGGQQGQQQQQQQQQQQGRPGQQQQQQANQLGQQQMQQTLERLKQAMDDMRQANNANAAGTPQGEAQARKAADRLREAEQMLSGMRGQQSANQLEGLTKQADELARKQQDFEGQMRRAYGNERGVTREQAEQLARQKDEEAKELKNLEAGMQQAVRDLQSTQRGASTKIREALGDMQQMELGRDMQRNAEWIRRGMGQYAVMSESQITAGLNEVREQLRQAQQAMGKGNDGKGQQNDQAVERTLRQVEQLRRQLEQMGAQQGQQGRPQAGGQQPGQQQGGQQNGQGKQGGQQQGQGQQAQQQGNQQGGQQGQGQQGKQGQGQGQGQGQQGQQGQGQGQGQQGQQGQGKGGQQAGGQYGGGQVGGDRNGGAWNGGAWNGGGNNNGNRWLDGPVRPADIQQTYRETMQSLQQLQQEYRDDPSAAREVQGLIRGLREFDPFALGNDPLLAQRIQAALAGVEQVEMELRKKVEITNGNGSVRSAGGEKVPEGFDKQVAEYFRKLSKGNK